MLIYSNNFASGIKSLVKGENKIEDLLIFRVVQHKPGGFSAVPYGEFFIDVLAVFLYRVYSDTMFNGYFFIHTPV
jgi:hypothetical protein